VVYRPYGRVGAMGEVFGFSGSNLAALHSSASRQPLQHAGGGTFVLYHFRTGAGGDCDADDFSDVPNIPGPCRKGAFFCL